MMGKWLHVHSSGVYPERKFEEADKGVCFSESGTKARSYIASQTILIILTA
jgi:hypothetical protein